MKLTASVLEEWHMMEQDKLILQELAKQYREYAEDPVNGEREKRARRINALKPDRPLVWIDEVPWHELNIDDQLTLRCEDPFNRQMEQFFRRKIMQWKYFQADTVLENFFRIGKAYTNSGFGMSWQENVRKTDEKNHIVSHEYLDQLDSEEKVAQLKIPVIMAQPEQDALNMERAQDILGDILPVKLSGNYHGANMWDVISRLRGVSPIYMDMVMNPELIHAIMKRFIEIQVAIIDQMDAQGLFSGDVSNLHCTPGWSDELDAIEKEKGPGAKSTWYRGMAQLFGSVSPEMHEEFEFDYIKPLAARFGLVYYGCCEPLYDRIDELKKIPNLRKIGVSPWSDVWASAEQTEGKYVLSKKPNPAMVAGASLDEDAIRKEIAETAEACIRYHCPCDIALKDISTAHYRIGNLARWAQIAEETLDHYYGK